MGRIINRFKRCTFGSSQAIRHAKSRVFEEKRIFSSRRQLQPGTLVPQKLTGIIPRLKRGALARQTSDYLKRRILLTEQI